MPFRQPAVRSGRSHGQTGPRKTACRLRNPRTVLRNGFTCGLGGARIAATIKITMSFTQQFLDEVRQVTTQLNADAIEKCAEELARVRERGGRLFILGVGGSAGNAGHAVNDFRKICGFEAYAPTDNVSELTARTNDDGWATIFTEWLKGSRLSARDGLLIFSVGGGNLEKNVSPNLVSAIQLAKIIGASVVGIVGRDGGYTAR